MKRNKIFITTVDPTYGSGQNSFSLNLIKIIAQRIDFKECWIFSAKYPSSLNFIKNKVIFFNTNNLKHIKILLFQLQLCYLFIKKTDAIFYFSLKPYFFSAIILRLLNIKYHVITEGYMIMNIQSSYNIILAKVYIFIVNYVIRGASSSSSCYQTGVDWLSSLSNNDIYKLHCGVSREFTCNLLKNKSIKEPFDLGYVGSFRDVHGINKLLDFCLYYKLTAKLVGDGQLFSFFSRESKYNNSGLFTFTGFISNSEVASHINDCNVMWGFSLDRYWGLPMKIIEYLSLNKPVLANTKSDLKYFIDRGLIQTITDSSSLNEINMKYNMCLKSIFIDDDIEYINKEFNWDKFNIIFNGK